MIFEIAKTVFNAGKFVLGADKYVADPSNPLLNRMAVAVGMDSAQKAGGALTKAWKKHKEKKEKIENAKKQIENLKDYIKKDYEKIKELKKGNFVLFRKKSISIKINNLKNEIKNYQLSINKIKSEIEAIKKEK